jgi:hypothetical protein
MMKTPGPRLRAAALLVLVTAVGFTAGVISDRLLFAPPALTAGAAPETPPQRVTVLLRDQDAPPPGPRAFRLVLPGQLAAQLDLSARQQAEIERILADDQAELRRLTEQFEPALTAVIERSRQRIEDVLTDEQREQWQAMPVRRLRTGPPDGGE